MRSQSIQMTSLPIHLYLFEAAGSTKPQQQSVIWVHLSVDPTPISTELLIVFLNIALKRRLGNMWNTLCIYMY